MSNLIKSISVPADARKNAMMCPSTINIYYDRVECIGGQGSVFFFKDYTGIGLQTASLYCAFASVIFLNSVNSGALPKNGAAMLADKNRINFSSGTFSYAAANNFLKRIYVEIKAAFESYKKDPKEEPGTVIQQASGADEIRKYKQLVDDGIISQDEFEEKKKQILGA